MSWWFPSSAQWDRQARSTLLAFPHAGGTSASLRSWFGRLPSGVQLAIAQLPGRGTRFTEPALDTWPVLMDALGAAVTAAEPAPLSLFGHSAGALVAFELAHWLAARGRAPRRLIVSACRAPQRPPAARWSGDGDTALVERLRRLGGTDALVFDQPELMQLVLPAVRADLALYENHVFRARRPLDVPIVVFGGLRDPSVEFAQLREWTDNTTAACDVLAVDGEHFYLDQPDFMALLRAVLDDTPPEPTTLHEGALDERCT